tara:strand:+ start:1930 stop:2577 length:648 start_codon:yes stop_codon:yes gene_type:complete
MGYSHVDNLGLPLEVKLDHLFDHKENGFFIELGANNGLFQSNTAYFEKVRKWKGILIEPSVVGYNQCIVNRPASICLNCACVSSSYEKEFVWGDFGDNHAMGSIEGKRLKRDTLVKVPSKTLEQILDDLDQTPSIDLLSLDTEGTELDILEGLNLDKYRPYYILVEIYNKDELEITNYLKNKNYELHSNFTNYNKRDNPFWDGTHNDYLFKDSNR